MALLEKCGGRLREEEEGAMVEEGGKGEKQQEVAMG